MDAPKILVVEDIQTGGRRGGMGRERSMNIACAVVITVVVVAMVIATIVYFCTNKSSGGGSDVSDMSTPVVNAMKAGNVPTAGAAPSSIPKHGVPKLAPPMPHAGLPVPMLNSADQAALAASGQLGIVKNHAQGHKNSYLRAIDRTHVARRRPIHRGDYQPFVRQDEEQFQRQTQQLKANPPQFNHSEQMSDLFDDNVVSELM